MRQFTLERDVDVSGISGTGKVAEGIEWSDGTVSIRWLSHRPSTVHWDSIDDAEAIHSHGGATRFVWADQQTVNKTLSNLSGVESSLGLPVEISNTRAISIPPEPADGSVVLTPRGKSFQRQGNLWCGLDDAYSWHDLIVRSEKVKLLYQYGDEPPWCD